MEGERHTRIPAVAEIIHAGDGILQTGTSHARDYCLWTSVLSLSLPDTAGSSKKPDPLMLADQ